jgi:hypothetical protein
LFFLGIANLGNKIHISSGLLKSSQNNPSSQIESLELDDLNKRLQAMQTALADPGTGIPMMSMHRALKEIMKMSDSEIKDMLNEIRLEKAMAAELAATANIIKKTGIFDSVDRIYGDYEAMNNPQAQQAQPEGEDEGFGGGGGGFGGGDLGGDMDMDLGEPGASEDGDLGGDMASTDMNNAPDADAGEPLMENKLKNVLIKNKNSRRINEVKSFTQRYFEMLAEENSIEAEPEKFEHNITTINNTINEVCGKIDKLINEDKFEEECLLMEATENANLIDNIEE